MRRLLIIAAAALSLAAPLAACGGLTADPPLAETLADERALFAAEAAYFGAASAAEAAVDAGVLSGEPAGLAADYLDRGYAALQVARRAHAAGNATEAATAAREALLAIGAAQAIIRPRPGDTGLTYQEP
jgi:hypothetical protein